VQRVFEQLSQFIRVYLTKVWNHYLTFGYNLLQGLILLTFRNYDMFDNVLVLQNDFLKNITIFRLFNGKQLHDHEFSFETVMVFIPNCAVRLSFFSSSP